MSISWQAKWKSCRSDALWDTLSNLLSNQIRGYVQLQNSRDTHAQGEGNGLMAPSERSSDGDKYLAASFKAILCSLVSESEEGAPLLWQDPTKKTKVAAHQVEVSSASLVISSLTIRLQASSLSTWEKLFTLQSISALESFFVNYRSTPLFLFVLHRHNSIRTLPCTFLYRLSMYRIIELP